MSRKVVNAVMMGLIGVAMLGLTGCGGDTSTTTPTVSIPATVTNIAPVAKAGTTQSVVTGTVVTLDGSGSGDANGDALTYKWTLTKPSTSSAALSSATAVKPTCTPDVAGSYVFSLVVNDGKIDSPAALVTLTAVANQGQLFDTLQTGIPSSLNGHYSAGSIFSLKITNNSAKTFNLNKAELINGSIPLVVGTYSGSALLNNNKIGPGESVTMGFELQTDTVEYGFKFNYYLADPAVPLTVITVSTIVH